MLKDDDDIKTFIFGVISSLLASYIFENYKYAPKNFLFGMLLAIVLYHICKYCYEQKIATTFYLEVIKKWHRIVKYTRLISNIIISSIKSINVFRIQKSYFSLAKNFAVLVLVITVALTIWLPKHVVSPDFSRTKFADETKNLLSSINDNKFAGELDVAYFIKDGEGILSFDSTKEVRTRIFFPADTLSIIGCVFAHPNSLVRFDMKSAGAVVISANGDSSFVDDRCRFSERPYDEIKSIVCSSYNTSPDPEYTVGICVSTKSEQNISSKAFLAIIRTRTEYFFHAVFPILKDQKKLLKS